MDLLMVLSRTLGGGAVLFGGASVSAWIMSSVFWLCVIYWLLLRPKIKEMKRVKAMLKDLEVGDVVILTSGFYGILIDITEEDVIVEFGSNPNCRIPMRKSAIEQVEKQCDQTS